MITARRGFTLIELMVSVSILIVMLLVSVSVTIALNKDFKILLGYLSSSLKGREVIDAVSKDLRIAVRVMDSYASYTTTDSSIVLKVPSIDASGQIIDVDADFDYVIYYISGGDLRKVVLPDPDSSRPPYNAIFKKGIESIRMEADGTPLSGVAHKSIITTVTIWVSINETILGKDYRIIPGTTVKLMNYEWEHVR